MTYRQYSFTNQQGRIYDIDAIYGSHPTEMFLHKDSRSFPIVASRDSGNIEEDLERRIKLVLDNSVENMRAGPISELVRQQEKDGRWFLPAEGIYLTYVEYNELRTVKIRDIKETGTRDIS